ncbi:MAG: hypothetical protein ACLQU4_05190 [Limisphaerales bacterium]
MGKLALLLSPRFLAALKDLGNVDVARVEDALRVLPDCFGQPHLHAGVSIRRLRRNVFECRAGLKVRLLFRANAQALEVFFVGGHDEVQRLIRQL